MPSLVIGIGGCSGSGKTTLSTSLLHALKREGYKTRLVQLDRYFKPVVKDYESPEDIDWESFYADVRSCPSDRILLLDGFLIFLSDIKFDIKFLLDPPLETLARRRRFRSTEWHWREPADYMETFVYPRYRENMKKVFEDLAGYHVLNAELHPRTILEAALKDIRPLIKQKGIRVDKKLKKAAETFFGSETEYE